VIAIALAGFLMKCGDDKENYLDGSLTKSYDFDFDFTRVRLYESELAIEYVVDEGDAEKSPCA